MAMITKAIIAPLMSQLKRASCMCAVRILSGVAKVSGIQLPVDERSPTRISARSPASIQSGATRYWLATGRSSNRVLRSAVRSVSGGLPEVSFWTSNSSTKGRWTSINHSPGRSPVFCTATSSQTAPFCLPKSTHGLCNAWNLSRCAMMASGSSRSLSTIRNLRFAKGCRWLFPCGSSATSANGCSCARTGPARLAASKKSAAIAALQTCGNKRKGPVLIM